MEPLSTDKLGATLLSIANAGAVVAGVNAATFIGYTHWTLREPSGMRIELVNLLAAEVRS
jgi:hypothetical protein